MLKKIPSLDAFIGVLRHVPYLASKNVYKVATHFLRMDKRQLEQFVSIVQSVHANVVQCAICFVWHEREKECLFCADTKRDQSIVCVVESWQDLLVIEKTEGYHGAFHVLGGAICPLDGIGPQDLTIDQLVDRVQQGVIKEIILATNQTPEGEATAAFIGRKLKGLPVVVSCLARGVPVGASLEFMDRITVFKALSERRPF